MNRRQRTLKYSHTFKGKGLHSGKSVTMVVSPAPANTGIRFYRCDLSGSHPMEAVADHVIYTQRCTTLEHDNVRIFTLEHLMSSLVGLGIDNAMVTIDTFEVPILDGSAKPYVEAFGNDPLCEETAPVTYIDITEPIVYNDPSGSIIKVTPSDHFSVDLTVDFNSKVLGVQKFHWEEGMDYAKELAPCRTFVFFHELEILYKNNLIRGGDLDNALVIVENPVSDEEISHIAGLFNVEKIRRNDNGYLDNVSLHYDNECVRHKMLDLLGDFSLVGSRINAHIEAFKSGHKVNTTVAGMIRNKYINNK